MGLDLKIACASSLPSWPAIAERLAARGLACRLAMIDGELSFPDEIPPADWKELRLNTANGMITLRREADGFRLVTWGNAAAALLADRDVLASVIGELTGGTIQA